MNFQDVAASSVEPGDDDDFVAGGESVEALDGKGTDLEPGVGSAFYTLLRGLAAGLDGGSDYADRTNLHASSPFMCAPPSAGHLSCPVFSFGCRGSELTECFPPKNTSGGKLRINPQVEG